MASDPKHPVPGDLVFDASELASFLVDLPEGALRGLRAAQEGFKEVLAEIFANQADWGEKAGILAADTADIEDLNLKIDRIDDFVPAGLKFVELLLETRAKLDDRRQRLVNSFAESVERRAKVLDDGDSLLARYQRTRAYRSAPGKKAFRTRRRKEQALLAQAEAAASQATTS